MSVGRERVMIAGPPCGDHPLDNHPRWCSAAYRVARYFDVPDRNSYPPIPIPRNAIAFVNRQVRHRALVVHLEHGSGYKRPEAIARNRAIRNEVAAKHLTRPPAGLDRHLGHAGSTT